MRRFSTIRVSPPTGWGVRIVTFSADQEKEKFLLIEELKEMTDIGVKVKDNPHVLLGVTATFPEQNLKEVVARLRSSHIFFEEGALDFTESEVCD